MTQIKASANKAADIIEVSTSTPVVVEESQTVKMVKERLKFYVDQFNLARRQTEEMKKQLAIAEEKGKKLTGSIIALQEMLKTCEGMP